jgi:CelD/BcsL family acetyltransferase involved in cellulose biosynthesis
MIDLFSAEIFKHFPEIQKVIITASYRSYSFSRSFLLSEFNDHIIQLPASIEDYYLTLGKKTRQHLKNYKSKLLRTFPKVKFVTKYGGDIDEDIIAKIVQLSFDRMTSKGIVPGKTQADTNKFYQYCQSYGCVTYVEVNGVIAAGSISYVAGDRIFLYMISHDHNYSKYNLGQVCLLYSIQTAIENRMSSLHLLWGDNEYKTRFAAKPNLLHTYVIYRSSSLSFMVDKVKAKFRRTLNATKQSKYTKPLRDFVKNYRKKNL